jgi:LysM repeat protein
MMAKSLFVRIWYGSWLSAFPIVILSISACQSGQESQASQPTETKIAGTPIQALIQTQAPEAAIPTDSPSPTGTGEQTDETIPATEIPPTPTTPPQPTNTPTPPPEPTFYVVQSGDTLIGIAEQFGVTLEALVIANGYTSADELPLIVGSQLQIPTCEAHQVLPGNTIAGIAQLCGFSMDELVTINIERLAPLGSLDSVPIGFILYFSRDTETVEGVDCSTQPPREQVIEYQPGLGEGLFCLSQKYGVSTESIIQGNIERLSSGDPYGSVSLLIPPAEGALYVVTIDDVSRGVKIGDIAEWYEVEPEAVTDWNGNPVNDPLNEGQQLYIFEANLAFGLFQSQPADEEAE